jgi:hypothetical protein
VVRVLEGRGKQSAGCRPRGTAYSLPHVGVGIPMGIGARHQRNEVERYQHHIRRNDAEWIESELYCLSDSVPKATAS